MLFYLGINCFNVSAISAILAEHNFVRIISWKVLFITLISISRNIPKLWNDKKEADRKVNPEQDHYRRDVLEDKKQK